MSEAPTAVEMAALKVAEEALLSPASAYGTASAIVFALGAAGMLFAPETAAELDALRARVAQVEAVLDGHRPPVSHKDAAARLRQAPGVWLLINCYGSYECARQVASQIRTGKLTAYGPGRSFRARMVSTSERHEVHACYVADQSTAVSS